MNLGHHSRCVKHWRIDGCAGHDLGAVERALTQAKLLHDHLTCVPGTGQRALREKRRLHGFADQV
jgi:hypothetical protein